MIIRMGSIAGAAVCLMVEECLNVVQRGIKQCDSSPLLVRSLDLRGYLLRATGP